MRDQGNLIIKRMNSKKRTLGYSTNDNQAAVGNDNIKGKIVNEITDSLINQANEGGLNQSTA